MAFEFIKTRIPDLLQIKPHVALDNRGFYRKYYEKNIFAANGIYAEFTESSDIRSKKGVLRGLHYQTICSQAKLLHVISGSIYDVAVDLRTDSPYFGQWEAFHMTAEEHKALFIPEGFAHGFLALEENTVFTYQCSGKYVPEASGGIAWDDADLHIPWPLEKIDYLIVSEKDQHNLSFEQYKQLENGSIDLVKGGEF